MRTSASYWKQPYGWSKKAAKTGERWTVFPSLCDPFDNEVPEQWRVDFWRLVYDTPNLTWLILTKRIGNAKNMLPLGFYRDGPALHVWLGASIVNQEEADRDIPKLLDTPAAKRFISYEPALGPVDFTALDAGSWTWDALRGTGTDKPHVPLFFGMTKCVTAPIHDCRRINQIIVGGESSQGGKKARPFDIEWARSTVRQCREAGVACFVKQVGSNPTLHGFTGYPIKDRAGADPAEWPRDLQVQQFPTT